MAGIFLILTIVLSLLNAFLPALLLKREGLLGECLNTRRLCQLLLQLCLCFLFKFIELFLLLLLGLLDSVEQLKSLILLSIFLLSAPALAILRCFRCFKEEARVAIG